MNFLFFLCLCLQIFAHPIKHVIVLMEENRSFDHMLGDLKKINPNINGLTGKECNPYIPGVPSAGKACVSFDAEPYIGIDPAHSFEATYNEIWGPQNNTLVPKMNGFVWANNEDPTVMQVYNTTTLPVLSTLAQEYAVFDNWYSSIPGPTQPNRLMFYSGTSYGRIHDPSWEHWIEGEYAPQRTFFNDLEDSGKSWKIYYSDFPTSMEMSQLRPLIYKVRPMIEFYRDLANGNLPEYTFLEPRWFDFGEWKENDQHPPHSVTYGEYFIKDIYESLYASPIWNNSLLIITYDEHGGLFDHVPPPQHVPNPDGRISTDPPYNFTTLGVRVPTVMISPWIKKGTIDHGIYDHTSIMHTVRKMLHVNLPPLTKREAWSKYFDHIITNKTRTDFVQTNVKNKKEFINYQKYERTQYTDMICSKDIPQINNLQKQVVAIAWSLKKDTNYNDNLTTCEASKYTREQIKRYGQ